MGYFYSYHLELALKRFYSVNFMLRKFFKHYDLLKILGSLSNCSKNCVNQPTDLVEICNYFVQKPETLHALVVEVELDVELVEVCDAGEDDADAGVGLAVEILRSANACTCVLLRLG